MCFTSEERETQKMIDCLVDSPSKNFEAPLYESDKGFPIESLGGYETFIDEMTKSPSPSLAKIVEEVISPDSSYCDDISVLKDFKMDQCNISLAHDLSYAVYRMHDILKSSTKMLNEFTMEYEKQKDIIENLICRVQLENNPQCVPIAPKETPAELFSLKRSRQDDQEYSKLERDRKHRGKYLCGKCNQPKSGHTCSVAEF